MQQFFQWVVVYQACFLKVQPSKTNHLVLISWRVKVYNYLRLVQLKWECKMQQ